MVIKILNKKWKVRVLKPKRYENIVGKGTAGMTFTDDREIYIHQENLDEVTIMHELTHAYVHELGAVELDLDDDQWEEFYAGLIGRFSRIMLNCSDDIIRYFSMKHR